MMLQSMVDEDKRGRVMATEGARWGAFDGGGWVGGIRLASELRLIVGCPVVPRRAPTHIGPGVFSDAWFVRSLVCQNPALSAPRSGSRAHRLVSGAWVFCALSKAEPMFVGAQSFASGRGKVSYGK